MKKTIAALMSLMVACAVFPPALAAETESPVLISEPPAVISETPAETTGRYPFEINGEDVSVDAVDLVPLRVIASRWALPLPGTAMERLLLTAERCT